MTHFEIKKVLIHERLEHIILHIIDFVKLFKFDFVFMVNRFFWYFFFVIGNTSYKNQ